jgi:hypothetical protein
MSEVVDELYLTFLSAKMPLERWNSSELFPEQSAERLTLLQSKIQQVAKTVLSYRVNDSDIVTTGDRTTVDPRTRQLHKRLEEILPPETNLRLYLNLSVGLLGWKIG